MYVFNLYSATGIIWYKVNLLKLSLSDLNAEFSFSYTGCHTKTIHFDAYASNLG